ncbi:hypothetical protein KBB76_01845 [Candidatus Saccharibacteria bacterium]|nr:hypothetical protein [Candidatus Saccharibacteria bacterium]
MSALRQISEEERLEIYDRLATKWALKMEARMARKRLLRKHPGLIISFSRKSPNEESRKQLFTKGRRMSVHGVMI